MNKLFFEILAFVFAIAFGYIIIDTNEVLGGVTVGCVFLTSIMSTIRFTLNGFLQKWYRLIVMVLTFSSLIGLYYVLSLYGITEQRIMLISLALALYSSIITLDETIRYVRRVFESDEIDDSEEHF